MAYTPTEWVDEVPQSTPLLYTIKTAGGDIIQDDVVIELKTPVTPGTPISAARLNNIEQGIATVEADLKAQIDAGGMVVRRQGHSNAANAWTDYGTTNHIEDHVIRQIGTRMITIGTGSYYGDATITFPVPFAVAPLVFPTPYPPDPVQAYLGEKRMCIAYPIEISPAQARIRVVRDDNGTGIVFALFWEAIGRPAGA